MIIYLQEKFSKWRLMSQGVNILIENAKLAYIGVYHFVFLPTLYNGAYFPITSSKYSLNMNRSARWKMQLYIIATIVCALLLINEVERSFMCLKTIFVFFFLNTYFFYWVFGLSLIYRNKVYIKWLTLYGMSCDFFPPVNHLLFFFNMVLLSYRSFKNFICYINQYFISWFLDF